jgi:dethiobiotin synthetase
VLGPKTHLRRYIPDPFTELTMYRKTGLFVVGTDTGVGKTLVSCGLVRLAHSQGIRSAGVKPVETGCVHRDGELFPEDGALLRSAAENRLTLQECAPFRFSLPASPARAAAAEGRKIRLSEIEKHVRGIAATVDLTIVEGAGGLMVPIDGRLMAIDLVERLGYPALLVARTTLGTINHTLLSVNALHDRGIHVAGIVLSPRSAQLGPEESHTPGDIAELVGDIPVAVLPFLGPDSSADPAAAAQAISRSIEPRIWRSWIGLNEAANH